jgi:hypothetical protein
LSDSQIQLFLQLEYLARVLLDISASDT